MFTESVRICWSYASFIDFWWIDSWGSAGYYRHWGWALELGMTVWSSTFHLNLSFRISPRYSVDLGTSYWFMVSWSMAGINTIHLAMIIVDVCFRWICLFGQDLKREPWAKRDLKFWAQLSRHLRKLSCSHSFPTFFSEITIVNFKVFYHIQLPYMSFGLDMET